MSDPFDNDGPSSLEIDTRSSSFQAQIEEHIGRASTLAAARADFEKARLALDMGKHVVALRLLNLITFQPLDRFTFFIPEAAGNRFFQLGQFIGVGVSNRWVGDRLFMAEVFPDSPAADRGFARGYEVLEINGTTVADIVAGGLSVSEAFGRFPGLFESSQAFESKLTASAITDAPFLFTELKSPWT